ncbi:hypothetical protein STRAU_6705 [Streptomyces aurantiacus JA 4570]|uniref:Uncharacterized protein n=1 Tax=Streptomyces aurantiacus JA 4570 TaxID=1286094 RepID=S3Z925_9ACTN|nr:hypothetical protein STRAU_6705 [Streptomyces aurantiacus JA 4570]
MADPPGPAADETAPGPEDPPGRPGVSPSGPVDRPHAAVPTPRTTTMITTP